MKRQFKSMFASILCLTCLTVPLSTSAEAVVNEYDMVDYIPLGSDESYGYHEFTKHIVEIESDLFRYKISTADYDDSGSPVYDGSGILETDVADVNFIVTAICYDDEGSEPSRYILNEFGEFGYDNTQCSAEEIAPFLDGETLKVGDLLYVDHPVFLETYPSRLTLRYAETVKNVGSGVEVFGEDFKKVLYYEMYSEPILFGYGPVSQSGYRYEIYDKGNLNNDGKVDLLDVITLNKNIMTGYSISYYAQGCADVDNNGVVNAVDSLNILKYVVGLIDSFEELQ